MANQRIQTLESDRPASWPAVTEIGEYLYDPDSTVVRSGLVGELAEQLNLTAIDYRIAWLTGGLMETAFATRYRVDLVCPLDVKTVARELQEREIGRVTILKRGIDVDTDKMLAKWTGKRPGHRFVIVTRIHDERKAILAERM